ncbi:hypothetical protein HRbin01_01608 [archaeon HR01]|nr:hypothetical protein HRbin01_01608 [archaeon HR01]
MAGESWFKQIPQVLAVLSYEGDYHYVDRLGYSHSKDLALYYLREAMRAFQALKRSPPKDMDSEVRDMIDKIDANYLDYEIENLKKIESTQELREILSLICAKALAIASKFVGRE